MNDLQKLTEKLGSPKKTAEALNVTLRTYWNYKRRPIPARVQEHIRLLLKANNAN